MRERYRYRGAYVLQSVSLRHNVFKALMIHHKPLHCYEQRVQLSHAINAYVKGKMSNER